MSAPAKPKSGAVEQLEEAKAEIKRLRDALEQQQQQQKGSKATNHKPSPNDDISSNNPAQASTSSSSSHHQHHAQHHGGSGSVDAKMKIKSLEETIDKLYKSLSSKKQEEAALLADMEITGQAFEDMQEQNVRLIQELREKDDANFKLVSERIKLENAQRILVEEKDKYAQQATALQEQQEAQLSVSKRLGDQVLLLEQAIAILEKELAQLQHTTGEYKRAAIDNVLLIQDLRLNTQKYSFQLKEAHEQIVEKSELLEAQAFSNKRAQEEIKHLQHKLERRKKFETAASMDEVLVEEIKEYKEQLRCPSCKVKQKDAVLTKCFHVFCFDCLQKRYDTRQRKCPKCNANFGANDFRKLYLS